jgi:hypothetical protein
VHFPGHAAGYRTRRDEIRLIHFLSGAAISSARFEQKLGLITPAS